MKPDEIIWSECLYRKARAREAERIEAERKEQARIAALSPLEYAEEQINNYLAYYCDYGGSFDELKELFKKYLAIEAGG